MGAGSEILKVYGSLREPTSGNPKGKRLSAPSQPLLGVVLVVRTGTGGPQEVLQADDEARQRQRGGTKAENSGVPRSEEPRSGANENAPTAGPKSQAPWPKPKGQPPPAFVPLPPWVPSTFSLETISKQRGEWKGSDSNPSQTLQLNSAIVPVAPSPLSASLFGASEGESRPHPTPALEVQLHLLRTTYSPT